MVAFNALFPSVYLAIVYSSVVNAAPWPLDSKHSTHRTRHVARGLKVESFYPKSSYETFGDGLAQAGSFAPGDIGLEQNAMAFVQSRLGLDSKAVGYKGGYANGENKYAYVKQYKDGIPFANAVANVAWKNNKVVSFGSSFVKPRKYAASKPSMDVKAVIPKVEAALDGKHNGFPVSTEYLARPDGSASLVYVIQIQNEDQGTWYEAHADAHSGELLSVTDFVSDASYKVLPINKETYPEGLETLTDPQNLKSSPLGWHDTGSRKSVTTAGNNVIAYRSSQSKVTTQSSPGLNFNYTYSDESDPTTVENIHAARTNAFYVINAIHDTAYLYGFTEKAFNFQANNFGKGGQGNDRVLMSVQDASGTNNADFATPPDGQSGICRMFVWTLTSPNRDGALENDIIVHEMTHGITNRMTGGGTGACLQATEAGGMGEGWSDALAEHTKLSSMWTEQKSANVTEYILGQYVTNTPGGIRTHPYSTSATTNPLRYSSIKTLDEVHNIGEVWANMLHNVYAALVEVHGFSSTAHTDATGLEGNVVYLHLFIDALALQPCNPTFVSARDAWIQADKSRYGGANACLLWKAFASRGLGVNAEDFVDDSSVPEVCA